jgi:hypothetical protein
MPLLPQEDLQLNFAKPEMKNAAESLLQPKKIRTLTWQVQYHRK